MDDTINAFFEYKSYYEEWMMLWVSYNKRTHSKEQ